MRLSQTVRSIVGNELGSAAGYGAMGTEGMAVREPDIPRSRKRRGTTTGSSVAGRVWAAGVRKCLLAIVGTAALCPTPGSVAQVAPDLAARQAMEQGAEAMSAGNFSAAVAAYSSVTRSAPAFAEGYLNLGLAQFQTGALGGAAKSLEKAQQLKPTLRGANLFLGIIAYRQNRLKDAGALLEREVRLDPRSAKAYMWLGVCRLAENDAQGAIAPLDKAYAIDPKDADILYHRGRAYMLVANASYGAMFKLDHDSERVHQVLAEAYAQSYRNQEAISEFELAVKMAPHQPGLHEELGDQYWVVGSLDKAQAAYHDELAIDPDADTAKYKLGSLLVLNQNASEGIPYLLDALRGDSSLTDAHYYLGTGLMATGDREQAIHEFQLAIAADPNNDRAMLSYYKLAQLYRGLGEKTGEATAMQNFLRMRAATKERQEVHSAQIARSRSELPVQDPELATIPGAGAEK
jgi:tetratricopeptide (TPR) repeat protein